MPIEDFIIMVFCCVDEFYNSIVKGKTLRRRGSKPKLEDREVITIEVVGEFMGLECDTKIWRYFKAHWKHFFPNLPSRSAFAKQSANLWQIKQMIQQALVSFLHAHDDPLHLVDGFPIPVCKFARAHFRKAFRKEAAYGYCAAKKEKYCGFKGNLLVNSQGMISDITVTAANVDERNALFDLVGKITGVLVGDRGLISNTLQKELKEKHYIHLQTPLRHNMDEDRDPNYVKKLISIRRLVETVIGQLTDRFHIEKVRARDLWHFTNRIARKILSHTLGVFLNMKLGRKPLQFDTLVMI